MRSVFVILFIPTVIVLSVALVIGVALGIGWVLTLFLPFTLFEGALLGIIAAVVCGRFWTSRGGRSSFYDLADEESELETEEIPEDRFWADPEGRTWANWYRYLLANAIHERVQEEYSWRVRGMKEGEVEEQSVRLADAALQVLRAKSTRAKRMRVSRGTLRRQIAISGQASQRTFEDDLLDTAAEAVNDLLVYLDDGLREVARGRSWDEPADLY